MLKVLKWIGIVLGSLVILILLIAGGMILSVNSRVNKVYNVQPEAITIPTDAASIAQGEHIVSLCKGCHGPDLSGTVMIDDPAIGHIESANLTQGKGGVGSEFKDSDFVLAIRHGLDPEKKTLVIMPANSFYYFSDQDLGSIIAYLKSLPPVDKEVPEPEFKPMGKLLIAAGQFGSVFIAETIDQTGPRPATPAPGVTTAYGDYLVRTRACRDCHGPDLAGGTSGGPNPALSPNLTPAGDLAQWSEADFLAVFRTGKVPSGKTLSDDMPWKDYGTSTDDELKAMFLYLQSLPPVTKAK
jgi:mono/diheme cytochrome c family protein